MSKNNIPFKALLVEESGNGKFQRSIATRMISDLPRGDLLIQVKYSALNYKDALSASGNRGVTKQYPHTPGVDAAGLVIESNVLDFREGDPVLVTGYDLGMNTSGGMAEYIRVPAEWVIPLPPGLSLKESMILGTAGLTAGIGLFKMEKMGQRPEMGPIVITGASGGVGSVAVGLFAKAGYEVIASTGKKSAEDLLFSLGASRVVDREFVQDLSGRPLIKPLWAGALDTVGGTTLSTLLKGCSREGNVASSGLVGSNELSTTVFPFILNGINLLGIDSATFPRDLRLEVWHKYSKEWRIPAVENIATFCRLNEIDPFIEKILLGKTIGRVVVTMNE